MRRQKHIDSANRKEAVIKRYHLDVLTPNNSIEKHNITLVIKDLLHQYHVLSSENDITQKKLRARQLIITGYSLMEAIIITVAYKLQKSCLSTKASYPFCSDSMFKDKNPNKNKVNAYINANNYLQKINIINFTNNEAKRFYEQFRQTRNDVHILKSLHQIDAHPKYTVAYCEQTMRFIDVFFKMLYLNVDKLCVEYGFPLID